MFAHAPNTIQLELKSSDGDAYLIQVAWPLAWDDPKAPGHSASILYVNLKRSIIGNVSSLLTVLLDMCLMAMHSSSQQPKPPAVAQCFPQAIMRWW